MGYRKALVIFIDILGTKNRTDFDELYGINELFHNELLGNVQCDKPYTAYQRHIYTFSDCAYIIYDFKDGRENTARLVELFNVALDNCIPLLIKFLDKELLFQGGAAYGDVYYATDKNMFFGEAVNKAYSLQNQNAIFPRIVIDDFLASTILEQYNNYEDAESFKNMNDSQIYQAKQMLYFMRKTIGCTVAQEVFTPFDCDQWQHGVDGILNLTAHNFTLKDNEATKLNCYMLNYLKYISQGGNWDFVNSSKKDFVDKLLRYCEAKKNEYKASPRIADKYRWLEDYVIAKSPHDWIFPGFP